jgi:hypothetical protein
MTTVAPKDLFLPLATYNVRKYEGSCNCSLVISLSIHFTIYLDIKKLKRLVIWNKRAIDTTECARRLNRQVRRRAAPSSPSPVHAVQTQKLCRSSTRNMVEGDK